MQLFFVCGSAQYGILFRPVRLKTPAFKTAKAGALTDCAGPALCRPRGMRSMGSIVQAQCGGGIVYGVLVLPAEAGRLHDGDRAELLHAVTASGLQNISSGRPRGSRGARPRAYRGRSGSRWRRNNNSTDFAQQHRAKRTTDSRSALKSAGFESPQSASLTAVLGMGLDGTKMPQTRVRPGWVADGLFDNALLKDDVGVDGSLAGLKDAVGLAGLVVEFEALIAAEGGFAARVVFGDDLFIFVPDGDLHALVLFGDLHDHDGMLDIFVERDDLQDRVEQLGHAVAVGTEENAVIGLGHGCAGEVAVADADAVAVAHFGQNLQKLR